MTPQEVARADQIRAALRHALETPCDCGPDCIGDDQLRAALALADADLIKVFG